MSNYNRTVWQDSPETEITAERLNNMEEGIKTANDGLYRPNLFINGNFQIWSNGESFEVYGTNNEESTTAICDKWYAKHYDLENNYYITKAGVQGVRLFSASEEPCYIYQRLDEETFNALQGKMVTLSWSYTQSYGDANHVEYETVDKSEQIVVGDDLDVFTAMTRIGFTSGINGCIIHYIKLEVGEIVTPCIPDSKDAIICKLENEVTKLNGNYIHNTWNNGYVTYEKTKNKVHVHGYIPINAKTGSISLPYKNYDNDPRVIPMIGMNADFTIIQGYGCGIVQRGGDTLEIQMSGATTFACCDFTYYTD